MNRVYDGVAAALLGDFLDRLQQTERRLLPRKKQRALEEMHAVLTQYRRRATPGHDPRRNDVVGLLLRLCEGRAGVVGAEGEEGAEGVDLNILAECWLDLIRPAWYERLRRPRRYYKPLLLQHLRHDLIDRPLETEQLAAILTQDLRLRPLAERVVSAIVGVPD